MDWGALYGLIVTATGWTYPVVDALTMADAMELLSYWKVSPPSHISLKAFVSGSGGGESEKPVTLDEEGLKNFVAQFSG